VFSSVRVFRFPSAGRLRVRLGVLTIALGVAAGALAVPAAAAEPWPGVVSGVHVAAQTSTSFTVALNAATDASWYRVTASTVEADIWMANINRPSVHRTVTGAASPRVVVGHLHYTSAAYYYRVATINGTHIRWSSLYQQTHLNPARPTALSAASGFAGTYLTWNSVAATGYSIEQATNSAFAANRRVYTTTNPTRRFTPYGLTKGTRYWFRVRAVNGSVLSGYSAAVSATPTTSEQHVRALTYNVLSHTFDGSIKGGVTQSPWSQRRPGAVSLLRQANADVMTVQEAAAYVDAAHRVRQVDSIAAGLGSAFAIANTDHGSNPGARQNSPLMNNYILYKRATVAPFGTGGHWMIGYTHNAAYQLFHVRATGATFLYVGTHLTSTRGATYDLQRRTQMRNVIGLARSFASAHGVTSILYGGDMNSWPDRYLTTDMPGNQMQLNLTMDAIAAPQTHVNARYSSINSYLRTPPQGGSADRIFATGGIAVSGWGELLHLSGGQFAGVIPSDHNPVYADVLLPY
jgi:hypothetical protein